MFCINHLNALRASEIELILTRFTPGARILELGAGTGRQALEISRRGFDVEAIEIGASNYAQDRLFPITDYDGRHIPFPDNSFDIVFSSNVLEHVPDLVQMHAEIRRVLRPGGKCVHVLPTDSWRFWTTVSAFPASLQYALTLRDQFRLSWPIDANERQRLRSVAVAVARHLSAPFRQTRHGERGNVLTEMWYFRPDWWRVNFRRNGFVIEADEPMGIFYTGNMVRHTKWSINFRQDVAELLGSACQIFELRDAQPKPQIVASEAPREARRAPKPAKKPEQVFNRCAYPWQQMIIDLTGEVVPCCYWSGYANTGTPLGNTNLQTIDEIWNGEAYTELRQRAAADDFGDDHPCGNCLAARAANGVFPRFTWPAPFTHEEGHCHLARLPEDFWADVKDAGKPIELLENEAPLTAADALHADIRAQGGGRYSAANGWLWFSTSDNSDPASNGRTYVLRCGDREVTLAQFDAASRSGRNLLKAYAEYAAGAETMEAGPSMISFISTADCNIDCPGCSQNMVRYAKVQHRKETVEDVLAHVPDLAQFIWHGGEPFLIKRFRDFVDGFETPLNPNLTFGFTSNGMMITAAEARKLEKFPRLNASVSIDSFKPETFAVIRAGAQFGRVLENTLRLVKKYNGTDWVVSVGMIICKSNLAEIDHNVGFAIEHEIGLNLSPVVVYPVNEQLNVFEDYPRQTEGWLAALKRAKDIAAAAKATHARATDRVDFSGMLEEIEGIIVAAGETYAHTFPVTAIIDDPFGVIARTSNAALVAYVNNAPIAYRMLGAEQVSATINLPLSKLPNHGKIRFDLLHSVQEPFGAISVGGMDIAAFTKDGHDRIEVVVPDYCGKPRGRNIAWANYGATTPDGNQVAKPEDVYFAYRRLYQDDVVNALPDLIRLP